MVKVKIEKTLVEAAEARENTLTQESGGRKSR